VGSDASNYVSASILCRYDNCGILCHIVFLSNKHILAKYNYKIYDKEFIGSVEAYKQWGPELDIARTMGAEWGYDNNLGTQFTINY
jgi:hypothetical protein